jgi:hypothetical protein
MTETEASPEPSIVFRSEKDSVPTILGAQRNNPYTVSNMTQAWNDLFGQHKTYAALPATHHYVKFDPQSLEEYKALAESGITYVDFPLDYVGNTVQFWRLLGTVTDYGGELGGGSYNNIQTEYNLWNNQGGRDHRNWSAATVMNALHHFHTEAQNDGINPPPMGLDIYLTANRTDGIALMTSQISDPFLEQWTVQGLFGSQLLPDALDNISILSVVPDVAIGCNFQNSDRQWAIAQHELAHTSHFTNVGAVFWGQLGLATLNARISTGSSWGDENVFDAGRLAICESWAEHLEHVYTDRAYGIQVSNTFLGTFINRLDAWRNHRLNHVPIGLHLDLIDNVEPATSDDRIGGGSGAVMDNVTGLTNGQLFSVLDAATDDPQVYRQRIINDLLPGSGIAVGDVDALFNSY